jgi:hypothetical protein
MIRPTRHSSYSAAKALRSAQRDLSRRIGHLEQLELRLTLSASPIDAEPLAQIIPNVTNKHPSGFTPAQMQHAYGFDQLSFAGGRAANGAGQTIAIVDAFNDPKIVSDLGVFDTTFGLPAPPIFQVVNQTGGSTLPKNSADWDLEISLDVEWAHAMAPKANIMLVEATNQSDTNLLAAVTYAKNQPGVSVVSMSWGFSEFKGETGLDAKFAASTSHPVTFVASSGDSGTPPIWPAASPNVLAVGGTTLATSDSLGTYSGETGWSDSGGGVSKFEKTPAFQASTVSGTFRENPDVAYDGNPNSGVAVYDSVSYEFQSGWSEVGGTSAGAPQWAALVAIADQGRALAGKPALSSTQALVYNLPSADFHDITSGTNGPNSLASPGYDTVTGLGSPVANLFVPTLLGASSPSLKTAAPPASANAVDGGVQTAAAMLTVPDDSIAPLGLGLAANSGAPAVLNLLAPTPSASVTAVASVATPSFATRAGLAPVPQSSAWVMHATNPARPLDVATGRTAQHDSVATEAVGLIGHAQSFYATATRLISSAAQLAPASVELDTRPAGVPQLAQVDAFFEIETNWAAGELDLTPIELGTTQYLETDAPVTPGIGMMAAAALASGWLLRPSANASAERHQRRFRPC